MGFAHCPSATNVWVPSDAKTKFAKQVSSAAGSENMAWIPRRPPDDPQAPAPESDVYSRSPDKADADSMVVDANISA